MEEYYHQAMEDLYRSLFTTKSFRRRRRRRGVHSITSTGLLVLLFMVFFGGFVAGMEDNLASFDSNFGKSIITTTKTTRSREALSFSIPTPTLPEIDSNPPLLFHCLRAELGANLEKSIAAVFSKVAYGSTTTTKRSIPDNVPPVVTTASSPILTTSHISSVTTARPPAKGSNSAAASANKKLNENVDDDAPLVDVVATRHDESLADTRKKHFDILDLPTLASNADILKTGGGGVPPPPPPPSLPRHHHGNRNYLSNSTPYPPPYGEFFIQFRHSCVTNHWKSFLFLPRRQQ